MQKKQSSACWLGLIALCSAGFLAFSGCSTPGGYLFLAAHPEVHLTDARITEETEDGIRIEMVMHLTNPNVAPPRRNPSSAELRLLRMHYTVELPGWGTFSMSKEPPITLANAADRGFVLPAAFARPSGAPLPGESTMVRVRGWIEYEHDGDFRFLMTEAGVPLPTRSFSREVALESLTEGGGQSVSPVR